VRELQLVLETLERPGASPAALATLVRVEGSSYRRPGARILLTAGGERVGSVSGGCLEEDLLAHCQAILAGAPPRTVLYDTTSENDTVWGVGLGCHGVVEVLVEPLAACPPWVPRLRAAWAGRQSGALAVRFGGTPPETWGTRWLESATGVERSAGLFLEPVPPPLALLVCGAGEDARPLVRIAAEFGWEITVTDPRPAYAKRERFPEARHVLPGPPESVLAALATDDRTAAVIMTHHYVHDLPLLRELARRPLAYLGLLGPRTRAERLIRELEQESPTLPGGTLERLHAPVGLDLGGDTPESVALSILAEITATVHGRSGRPLRERRRPIHAIETAR
jgi:xanthine/CO dehydrogenase XdhC/CoxF family maturation factor